MGVGYGWGESESVAKQSHWVFSKVQTMLVSWEQCETVCHLYWSGLLSSHGVVYRD